MPAQLLHHKGTTQSRLAADKTDRKTQYGRRKRLNRKADNGGSVEDEEDEGDGYKSEMRVFVRLPVFRMR